MLPRLGAVPSTGLPEALCLNMLRMVHHSAAAQNPVQALQNTGAHLLLE